MSPADFLLLAVAVSLTLAQKHDGLIGRSIALVSGVLCLISWFGYCDAYHWSDTILLSGSIGIVVFFGILTYILPSSKPTEKRLDPSKINVFLSDAQDFNYDGATFEDKSRIIGPPIQIEHDRIKDKIGFVFGVDIGKENRGIPVSNVRLTINFKKEYQLELSSGDAGDGKQEHQWQFQDQQRYAWYRFSIPLNERWTHPWTCLFVKFPRPGNYIFDFTITGDGIHEEIKKAVEVKVYPPND